MAEYAFAPHQPDEVDIKLLPGLFIKTVVVPDAGTVIPQHSHETAHVSLLSRGALRAWKDDVLLGDFSADPRPVPIVIEARAMHRFETLVPGVVFSCIHAVDGMDDPAIHEFNGLDFVDTASAPIGDHGAACPTNEGT